MPTNTENLQLAYTRSCQAYADLCLNPRPNYSIDGRSYSWNELRTSLLKDMQALQLAILQSEGPWEITTYGEGG